MIKSHEIKNVMDFNVTDSVRCDIKVVVTKTGYTVSSSVLSSIELNPLDLPWVTVIRQWIRYVGSKHLFITKHSIHNSGNSDNIVYDFTIITQS